MTDRILVPIDDSEPARTAFEEALQRFTPDEIFLLDVLDTDESSHGIEGGAADGWVEAKETAAAELFEKAERVVEEHDVALTTAIEMGTPARTIVQYAREQEIDHVVMGSHGRSGVSRVLVGSVAESVVRNSPVSVTIARDSGRSTQT